MLRGNAVIGQSGGPTSVINSSLAGIINAAKEHNPFNTDYQIEFTKTIPAGAKCCNFVINEKKEGV